MILMNSNGETERHNRGTIPRLPTIYERDAWLERQRRSDVGLLVAALVMLALAGIVVWVWAVFG